MLFTNFLPRGLVAAALISSVAGYAVDIEKRALVTIGVRHMSRAEADATEAAGGLLVNIGGSGSQSQGGQLGNGKYVTTNTLAFAYEPWHALVQADGSAFADAKKVWVPEHVMLNGQKIYTHGNEFQVSRYVKACGGDPATTIRMHVISTNPQFLIPDASVTTENPFAIKVKKAVKGMDQLPYTDIDMSTWHNILNPEMANKNEDTQDRHVD
ncbi:hypothetical protein B0H66DRAFT_602534 [Apodospora peruviana]|uniref:Uncharacterized protein n=1 Tax=Apodospora peruviana TaxID=516989 RepID=A0AAE0M3F2_9PEZI|nr:hypothetical protein B0H66DRAFT_602534 [Apodospora peruviana]